MIGHLKQSLLEAIASGAAGEHESPWLNVGVRRCVLRQSESFVDEVPRHWSRQKPSYRVSFKDRLIECRDRRFGHQISPAAHGSRDDFHNPESLVTELAMEQDQLL